VPEVPSENSSRGNDPGFGAYNAIRRQYSGIMTAAYSVHGTRSLTLDDEATRNLCFVALTKSWPIQKVVEWVLKEALANVDAAFIN
jgi:hypothetical protein